METNVNLDIGRLVNIIQEWSLTDTGKSLPVSISLKEYQTRLNLYGNILLDGAEKKYREIMKVEDIKPLQLLTLNYLMEEMYNNILSDTGNEQRSYVCASITKYLITNLINGTISNYELIVDTLRYMVKSDIAKGLKFNSKVTFNINLN